MIGGRKTRSNKGVRRGPRTGRTRSGRKFRQTGMGELEAAREAPEECLKLENYYDEDECISRPYCKWKSALIRMGRPYPCKPCYSGNCAGK